MPQLDGRMSPRRIFSGPSLMATPGEPPPASRTPPTPAPVRRRRPWTARAGPRRKWGLGVGGSFHTTCCLFSSCPTSLSDRELCRDTARSPGCSTRAPLTMKGTAPRGRSRRNAEAQHLRVDHWTRSGCGRVRGEARKEGARGRGGQAPLRLETLSEGGPREGTPGTWQGWTSHLHTASVSFLELG